MNIAVIAANGRTGVAFVKMALSAGHTVRAGVHRSNPFDVLPNLSAMTCDASSIEDVRKLLKGQDVVVSLIGHVKGSPADVQTRSTETIIKVMQEYGISRLISLTGTGVRFEGDRISLADRFLNSGIAIIDPARIKDGKEHVELIKKSGLDWTILRVLKLQNIAIQPYTLTTNGPTKIIVGRQEVSRALVDIIDDALFIQQAPMISPYSKET